MWVIRYETSDGEDKYLNIDQVDRFVLKKEEQAPLLYTFELQAYRGGVMEMYDLTAAQYEGLKNYLDHALLGGYD